MLRLALALLLLGGLTTSPGAQVTVTGVVERDLNAGGTPVPAGTPLVGRTEATGSMWVFQNPIGGLFPTWVQVQSSLSVDMPTSPFQDVTITSSPNDYPSLSTSGAIRLTFASPTTRTGFLDLREGFATTVVTSPFPGQPPFTSYVSIDATVDIGADGTIEFGGGRFQPVYDAVLPITVGPSGTDVLIDIGSAPGAGGPLQVRYRETVPGVSAVVGSPCSASLSATVRPASFSFFGRRDELVLDTADLDPTTTFHALVFGTQDPNQILPPSGCTLHTDILVVIPVTPDAAGLSQEVLAVPPSASGGLLRTQYLTAPVAAGQATAWFTSQALLITLP